MVYKGMVVSSYVSADSWLLVCGGEGPWCRSTSCFVHEATTPKRLNVVRARVRKATKTNMHGQDGTASVPSQCTP